MEKFDQKIRNKILSLEYNQAPVESLMSGMFEQLDEMQGTEAPIVELTSKHRQGKFYNTFFKVAASVALLIAFGVGFFLANEVSLRVLKGSKLTHQLPDGSSVELNADSKIKYNKLSWMFTRNVSLEGEAFFKVEKGENFTVSSRLGNTQVLGTSFNIYSRGQDYIVECMTGSVNVNYVSGTDKIILKPGEGVKFRESEKGSRFSFDNENLPDWRSGEFHFDNEPLKNVIATFSRQYNIEVRLDKKYEQKKYSGYFNDKNLGTALKLICDPIELDYQIMEGYVVIE